MEGNDNMTDDEMLGSWRSRMRRMKMKMKEYGKFAVVPPGVPGVTADPLTNKIARKAWKNKRTIARHAVLPPGVAGESDLEGLEDELCAAMLGSAMLGGKKKKKRSAFSRLKRKARKISHKALSTAAKLPVADKYVAAVRAANKLVSANNSSSSDKLDFIPVSSGVSSLLQNKKLLIGGAIGAVALVVLLKKKGR